MYALTRVDGWPERLAEYLDRRALLPFSWGMQDCAMFAADAVKEITGVDIAEDLRGTYSNADQALRLSNLLEEQRQRLEKLMADWEEVSQAIAEAES